MPNLEFLYIVEPKQFEGINFAEFKNLKWLKLLYLYDLKILATLSLNKHLTGLFIRNETYLFIECEFIFRKFIHPNLETLWLEVNFLDRLDLKWLAGLTNLKNLLIFNIHEEMVTMKLDLSCLTGIESIHFDNIKFRSLNLKFSKLANLKR